MLISAEFNRKLKQKQSETSKIPSFFISRLFVPSSRTKTQHGVPFLSTSMMPCWKFHSRCLGVCFAFTRKEIYLWAVDCWSLFISPLALRGHTQPNPAHLPLCLSVSQTASVPGLHVEGGEGRGEASTTHQEGEQGRHDSLMTLAFVYHIIFTNHLNFIYVRLCTPTQSVTPVGLDRLRVKLAG